MDNFFDIDNRQIDALGQVEAVRLFGELLQAETRRLGIAPEIRISERVTTPDGGIDASVNNCDALASELIKTGYSGYQIKTGSTFELTKGKLREELFGRGNEVMKENIGESVRRCLDVNGHLTFVCFGCDPTESQNNKAHDFVKEWMVECGYQNVSVRFWGQSVIKGFLGDFPSLCLKVNGRGGGVFETFEIWKSHSDMEPDIMSLGEKQNSIIEEVRGQLLSNIDALHLRVTGESGIGKTRLVLEALNEKSLHPLVIYSDKPKELENQGFLSYIAMPDHAAMEIILVLDECSSNTAGRYWNRLGNLGKRVRLITIYNEEYVRNGSTRVILMPPLEEAQVADILKQYSIPDEHIYYVAQFCEGSPRFAKIIGGNIKNNSSDLLADLDNISPSLTERYVAGQDDLSDQTVRDRLLILRFLSLFKRFGYRSPVSDEAAAIYQLVHEYDSSITRACFDQSIQNLHDRRILQGEHTYYITPKPLQVKLWIEWWDKHSTTFDIERFNKLPPLLVEGFNDMFRFARESGAAMQTVERLLDAEGPFANGDLLRQDHGGTFFLALTEGAPERALELLERTVGSWNEEQLIEFKEGRMKIVWALERIGVWEGLFDRAARLLLKLAEAENDNAYSNNATGTFKDFFSVFSSTQEPPMRRLPVVEELLQSGDEAKERLALKAITVALEDQFTRIGSPEYQGLPRDPHLWEPVGENRQEAHDYMTRMWILLVKILGSNHEINRNETIQTLSRQLEIRGRNPETSNMALETAQQIFKERKIEKNKLIEIVVHILHYGSNELPEDIKLPWHKFYEELVPDDLSSQINRYVAFNLLEDLFVRGEHSEEDRNRTIKDLAKRTYENSAEFRKNLPWLVTERAVNGYLFGHELGKLDVDKSLLREILEARRVATPELRPSQYFLGGYLRALCETNPQAWESLFGELAKDETFLPLMPELAWRGGITDNVMQQLVTLTEGGSVDPALMGHFKYGVEIRDLGGDTFQRLVKSLLSHKKRVISSVALDIFARYYTDKEAKHETPKELALELLMDPVFFVASGDRSDAMDEYIWARIASKFLDKFSTDKDAVMRIGLLMLDSIGNDGSIVNHTDRNVKAILSRISELYPDEMWMRALTNLEEKGYFIFKYWLGSNAFLPGDQANLVLLEKINLETLWRWVEQDMEKRPWFIAALVPNTFTNEPGGVCIAREILVRYGEREEVRRNLTANFFSEGWSGRASDHYKAKLVDVETKIKNETHPKVIRWIKEYIQRLKDSIKASEIEEEREGFDH